MTMKKDGIQTRNRKLAARAKKKRINDFFKPFDPRFGSYTAGMGGAGGYLSNPMTQYYGAQMGHQFMSSAMGSMGSMGSMAALTDHSLGSDPIGLGSSGLLPSSGVASQHHPSSASAYGVGLGHVSGSGNSGLPSSMVGASAWTGSSGFFPYKSGRDGDQWAAKLENVALQRFSDRTVKKQNVLFLDPMVGNYSYRKKRREKKVPEKNVWIHSAQDVSYLHQLNYN